MVSSTHRVGRDDAVLVGVGLDHLEFDSAHAAAHEEHVVLAHGAVGLEEVRLEEDVEEVARDALDRVVDREDVHALAVLDVGALVDGDDVAEAHLEVLPHALVHTHLAEVALVVSEHDADGVLTPFALDEDRVATEELKGEGRGEEVEREWLLRPTRPDQPPRTSRHHT